MSHAQPDPEAERQGMAFVWALPGMPGARPPPEWGRDEDDKKPERFAPPRKPQPQWHDAEMFALEKDLVAEINRLRQDPRCYDDSLAMFRAMYAGKRLAIPGHLTIRTQEGPNAVSKALAALRTAKPARKLTRSMALDRAALDHATSLREGTKLSHLGRDGSLAYERMSLYGDIKGAFAEVISAGYRSPDLALMSVVVDDGVATRANRINLLTPILKSVGVACAPHQKYIVVCVIKLAGSIDAYREAPPRPAGDKNDLARKRSGTKASGTKASGTKASGTRASGYKAPDRK